MYKYEEIRSVDLELTELCQAACPMCFREKNTHLTNAEYTLQDIKNIFEVDFIKKLEHINFCGNFGDPIIAKDFLEILKYFKLHNNTIRFTIHTNAGARTTKWWQEFSTVIGPESRVFFSVDGLQDTNHIYRKNVKWDIVLNSMKAFISCGGHAIWDFLVFDHNEHQIEKVKEYAKELGFKEVRIKKSNRKNIPNPMIANILNNDDIITCKAVEDAEIYISAEGLLFPCCWLGGDLYHPKSKFYRDSVRHFIISNDYINVRKHGIKYVLENTYFDDLEKSWETKECLPTCKKKCGKRFASTDYELI